MWADSTTLNFTPLDLWLPDALQPEGFWAYSYSSVHANQPLPDKSPAVWLMAAAHKHTLIVDRWRALCDDYWQGVIAVASNATAPLSPVPYFWMAALFHQLMITDPEARQQWINVPVLDCNVGYGANLLRNRSAHEAPVDSPFIKAMYNTPPYAMKLSTRRFPSSIDAFPFFHLRAQYLRAYHAVQAATRPTPQGARVHIFPLSASPNATRTIRTVERSVPHT